MITYQVEQIIDVLEELSPLLEKHYEEIAWKKDCIKFAPDYDRYLRLEEAGIMHTVTARKDGKIVGYFISFVQPNLHYSENIFAVNDILYIDPSLRATGVAEEMFKFAEERLKELGVSVIVLHMKIWLPFEGLATKLGFEKIEYNYSKYLGE